MTSTPGVEFKKLALVDALLDELGRRGIRYCHWKSNASLQAAVLGVGDLDLLVDPAHVAEFTTVLAELGFLEAVTADGPAGQATRHYIGLDEPSGQLVHLDVYTRLLTGGTLLKNHHLPVEEMVFENLRCEGGVPVASRAAELVLLVLRKTIESGSVLEHALLMREYDHVRRELSWLSDEATLAEAPALVARWFPSVPLHLFERCRVALSRPGAAAERFVLARHLSHCLRQYEVRSPMWGRAERVRRLGRAVLSRYGFGQRGFRLRSGGAIIGFLGPEASGKSTLVENTIQWLEHVFDVRSIRAGTPPPSLLTLVPNLLLPTLRAALPTYRTSNVEALTLVRVANWRSPGVWLYLLRCIGIGDDRRRLLRRADRFRRQGMIVISDRYPSTHLGFIDSQQLDPDRLRAEGHILAARLAGIERWLYAQVPRADLLLTCYLPMAEMVKRNAARNKVGGPEPDDYVRRRHVQFTERLPEEFRQHMLDTTRPLDETTRTARRLIWQTLVALSAEPRPDPRHVLSRNGWKA